MGGRKAMNRTAEVIRKTAETEIHIALTIEGKGTANVKTGVGFLDHMLSTLAKHGAFDMTVEAKGDIHIDEHHTVEDAGLTLGEAFKKALGEKKGIWRFGWAICPMDEALARVVIDLSGRPHFECHVGEFKSDPYLEFFRGFVSAYKCTLHIDLLRGQNRHHAIEAIFKAFALALSQAVAVRAGINQIPSTKGTL